MGANLVSDIKSAFEDTRGIPQSVQQVGNLQPFIDRALEYTRALDYEILRDRVQALEKAFAVQRILTQDIAAQFDLDPALGSALDIESMVAKTEILASLLSRPLNLGSIADQAFINDLVEQLAKFELDRASRSAETLSTLIGTRNLGLGPLPEILKDLIEARDNLLDTANNFCGADLSDVNLEGVDLVGVRWDNATRWPTSEWAARLYRASVEDPPGSGVFTVLPEEAPNFDDRGALAPIP